MRENNNDINLITLIDQGTNWNDTNKYVTSIQCMYVPNYIKEIIKSASPVYEQELSISNAIRIYLV